jgi:hypothetical protein
MRQRKRVEAGLIHFSARFSDHDGKRLLRVNHGEAFEGCDPAKFLIGCDENGDEAGLLEHESDSELQGVECSERLDRSMLEDQPAGDPKVLVVDGGYQETALAQIGVEAAVCEQGGFAIDLPGSHLERKNGFHFHDGEAGDYEVNAALGENAIQHVAADLATIGLGQGAGVEELSRQLALSPLCEYGFGERAADGRQGPPDFL